MVNTNRDRYLISIDKPMLDGREVTPNKKRRQTWLSK